MSSKTRIRDLNRSEVCIKLMKDHDPNGEGLTARKVLDLLQSYAPKTRGNLISVTGSSGWDPSTIEIATALKTAGAVIFNDVNVKGRRLYLPPGSEMPTQVKKRGRKGKIGLTKALECFTKYYIDMADINDLASEFGVSKNTLWNKFSELRQTKTGSDILVRAKSLGNIGDDGKRIKITSMRKKHIADIPSSSLLIDDEVIDRIANRVIELLIKRLSNA